MTRLQALRWLLVPDISGVECVERDGDAEQQAIQQFWSHNPLQFNDSDQPRGSHDYFAEVAANRYQREWQIPELVPFHAAANCRVLEIGCGQGTDGSQFARQTAGYIGIDLTLPAVRLAQRRFDVAGLPGQFFQANARALPFPAESFDMVYSYGVLHHVPDISQAVAEIHRVLRPGGTAVLMLYHKHSWLYYRICFFWMLLTLLRFPAVAWLAARCLGYRQEDIQRWQHGLRSDPDQLFARFLGKETDAALQGVNPHSQVFSRSSIRDLLQGFEIIGTRAAFWLDLPLLERLLGQQGYRALMRLLGNLNGWHLFIYLRKPQRAAPNPATAAVDLPDATAVVG